ncbi:hypothetical protein ACJX0J_015509, partial [Zea mays]
VLNMMIQLACCQDQFHLHPLTTQSCRGKKHKHSFAASSHIIHRYASINFLIQIKKMKQHKHRIAATNIKLVEHKNAQ